MNRHSLAASLLLAATAGAQSVLSLETFPVGAVGEAIDSAKATITPPIGDLTLLLVHVCIDPEGGTGDGRQAALQLYPFLAAPDHEDPTWKLSTLRTNLQVDQEPGIADEALDVPAWRIEDLVAAALAANGAERAHYGVLGSGSSSIWLRGSTAAGTDPWDERYPWHQPGVWPTNLADRFDVDAIARETVLMHVRDLYHTFNPGQTPNADQIAALYDVLEGELGFLVSFQCITIQADPDPPERPRLVTSVPKVIKRASLGPNVIPRQQMLGGLYTLPSIVGGPDSWITARSPGAILRTQFEVPIDPAWSIRAFVPVVGGGFVLVAPENQVAYPFGHPNAGQMVMPDLLDFVLPANAASGYVQYIVDGTWLLAPKYPADGSSPGGYYDLSTLLAIVP